MTSQPGGSSSNNSNKPETVIAMKPEVAANDSGSSPKVNFSISKFDILFKILLTYSEKSKQFIEIVTRFYIIAHALLMHSLQCAVRYLKIKIKAPLS